MRIYRSTFICAFWRNHALLMFVTPDIKLRFPDNWTSPCPSTLGSRPSDRRRFAIQRQIVTFTDRPRLQRQDTCCTLISIGAPQRCLHHRHGSLSCTPSRTTAHKIAPLLGISSTKVRLPRHKTQALHRTDDRATKAPACRINGNSRTEDKRISGVTIAGLSGLSLLCVNSKRPTEWIFL